MSAGLRSEAELFGGRRGQRKPRVFGSRPRDDARRGSRAECLRSRGANPAPRCPEELARRTLHPFPRFVGRKEYRSSRRRKGLPRIRHFQKPPPRLLEARPISVTTGSLAALSPGSSGSPTRDSQQWPPRTSPPKSLPAARRHHPGGIVTHSGTIAPWFFSGFAKADRQSRPSGALARPPTR